MVKTNPVKSDEKFNEALACVHAAMISIDRKKYSDAEKQLTTAIKLYNSLQEKYKTDINLKISYLYALDKDAQVLEKQGKNSEAINTGEEVLTLRILIKNSEKELIFDYSSIANLFKLEGEFEYALNYYEKAAAACKKINSSKELAFIRNKQAKICYDQQEYQESLKYWKEAFDLYRSLNMKVDLAYVCQDYARALMEISNRTESIKKWDVAINLWNELIKEQFKETYKNRLIDALLGKGKCQMKLENWSMAAKTWRIVLPLLRKKNDSKKTQKTQDDLKFVLKSLKKCLNNIKTN